MQKKSVSVGIDFVKWFSELNKNSGPVAGGKGANLGEIYNSGIPVPNGFVITAQAYDYFIEKSEIKPRMLSLLSTINYEDTAQLNKVVEEIKKLIIGSEFPEELKEDILEAYETLGIGNLDIDKGSAKDILNVSSEPVFVAVRSSATSEDLAEASFAGQQETFLNIKGNDEIIDAVKRCFASLFTPRATYYRNKKGFKHEDVSLAVVVQKMVQSDKSGVIFSKDPSYDNENIIIESVYGLGEGIVSGQITPDHYIVSRELKILETSISEKKIAFSRDSSGKTKIFKLKPEISNAQVLKEHELRKLADLAIQLEVHYGKPQDIEFAIEKGEIFIVQTRPITTIEKRLNSEDKGSLTGEVILSGLAASPGVASGIVRIVNDLNDLDKIKTGDVLVTEMTNPDMVVSMQKSSAIITDEGGLTAHAAIVSREMGIPCVVGTENATSVLEDNMEITVDGFHGLVYQGKVASKTVEILPIVETKTKIKVNVDLPDYAERAAKTKAYGIGLVRIEGIIASSGQHPLNYLNENNLDEYKQVLKNGIEKICSSFVNKEIWIRTSDIRTDEFQHLKSAPKVEVNPMLGMHGIRFSLKYPEIFKTELLAIKELAEKGHKFGIMFPQIIDVKEVEQAKKIMIELGIDKIPEIRFGVMIETAAATVVIEELCKQGISFISFGTNDLTQYTLAIDRGNEEVQYLYDEMNLAVLKQLTRVIRICKQYKVETSICGQAANKKEMVEFLVKHGIDSLSVNSDSAREISEFVKGLEDSNPTQN